ncbi:MAG: hypothetical protein AAFY12_09450, partial [Pseudomonadota bacterium]
MSLRDRFKSDRFCHDVERSRLYLGKDPAEIFANYTNANQGDSIEEENDAHQRRIAGNIQSEDHPLRIWSYLGFGVSLLAMAYLVWTVA